MTELLERYYDLVGDYLGYPVCCVKDFKFNMTHKPKREKRKLSGTGYVPCPACNSLSVQQLIDNIKINRKCEKPFPSQDLEDDKQINNWLENLNK